MYVTGNKNIRCLLVGLIIGLAVGYYLSPTKTIEVNPYKQEQIKMLKLMVGVNGYHPELYPPKRKPIS